jgi:hypothetical protein
MMTRLILVVAFAIPALASAYMTWLTWRAGDDGKWLFTVFTVFFLLLVASPFLPQFKSKPKPESASTRFVPHWFMLLAALVLLGAIVVAIIGGVMALLRQ